MGGYYEVNLLLLHKRRIHQPIGGSSICGELGFTDSVAMVSQFAKPILTFENITKTFRFKIPFERGQVQPDSVYLRPVIDSLQQYEIDRIHVKAFASVEGFDNVNSDLYRQRAESIYAALQQFFSPQTRFEVESGENWPLFYQQINRTSFAHWKDWPKAQVKAELQKPELLARWESRLREQRQAHITVEAHTLVRDTLTWLQSHYPNPKPPDAAVLQNFLYQGWKQGRVPGSRLLQIQYPKKAAYSYLIANQLNFAYQIHPPQWGEEDLDEYVQKLRDALSIKGTNPEIRFTAQVFTLSQWESFPVKKPFSPDHLLSMIKQLEKYEHYRPYIPRLKAVFYLKTLPRYADSQQFKKVSEGLTHLYQYYQNHPAITSQPQRALQLAKFFVALEGHQYAFMLLDDFYTRKALDAEMYTYFVKLAVLRPQYQQPDKLMALLLEAKQQLTEAQWCDLFVGPCHISFQVFDDERLRNLYCENCAAKGNYATRSLTEE